MRLGGYNLPQAVMILKMSTANVIATTATTTRPKIIDRRKRGGQLPLFFTRMRAKPRAISPWDIGVSSKYPLFLYTFQKPGTVEG